LKRSYHTITTKGPTNARRLAEFFSRNGQGLLPLVDLIEQSRLAVDELNVAGRAMIETVLQLSAEQLAGPRTPGQRRQQLLWHGPPSGSCVSARAQAGRE
jgi:putative transposase